MAVSTPAGATALTWMPSAPRSFASHFVSAITPPLAAAQAGPVAGGDPRMVAEDVEPPQPAHARGDHATRVRGAAHVGPERHRAPPKRNRSLRRFLGAQEIAARHTR